MSIVVSCQCGGRFQAPPHLAGKQVNCPSCQRPLMVPQLGQGRAGQPHPAQASAPAQPASSGQPIPVACRCGGRFQAPPHLAGKQVACPNCRQPITVPQAGQAAAPAGAGALAQPAYTGQSAAPSQPPGHGAAHGVGHGPGSAAGYAGSSGGVSLWDDKPPEAVRNTPLPPSMRPPPGYSHAAQYAAKPGKSSMPPHTKSAYTALMAFGILQTLGAVVLTGAIIFLLVASPIDLSDGRQLEFNLGPVMGILLILALWITPIISFLGLYLFRKRSYGAVIISLIIGFLSLPNFPIGTLIGYYLVRGGFSQQTKDYIAAR